MQCKLQSNSTIAIILSGLYLVAHCCLNILHSVHLYEVGNDSMLSGTVFIPTVVIEL